jgi:predicted RNA binding protein YcfA (HicA-like mRNA interferase family)
VYLLVEGVWVVAKYVWQHSGGASGPLSARDCWVAARLYLFYHEIFHHNVESFATRLEVSHRQPLYINGFQAYYSSKVGTPDCLEESLAEANAFRKVCDKRFFPDPSKLRAVTRAIFDFVKSGPPGYAEGARLITSPTFNRARNRLAEESTQASIRGVPGKPPAVWDAARYMMRGFNDKAKGRAKYVIAAHSPLASRMPFRPRLKPLELKRQLRKFDCYFVRQGGNHEIWAAPNGRSVQIPRHPGDLGTGLVGKILKQAGIELSLVEFAAA